jgi:hypothetical protein
LLQRIQGHLFPLSSAKQLPRKMDYSDNENVIVPCDAKFKLDFKIATQWIYFPLEELIIKGAANENDICCIFDVQYTRIHVVRTCMLE